MMFIIAKIPALSHRPEGDVSLASFRRRSKALEARGERLDFIQVGLLPIPIFLTGEAKNWTLFVEAKPFTLRVTKQ